MGHIRITAKDEIYAQLADCMADVRTTTTAGEARFIAQSLARLSREAQNWSKQLPSLAVRNGIKEPEPVTDEDEVLNG